MGAEVAVHDPPVGGGEFVLDDGPAIWGSRLQTRSPEVLVEFDDGEPGRGAQGGGEGRLPRAATAEDHHALHGRDGASAATRGANLFRPVRTVKLRR